MKNFKVIAGFFLLIKAINSRKVPGDVERGLNVADAQSQPRIFLKKVWRARSDRRELKGGVALSHFGDYQMIVEGYYTSREMSGLKFDFTKGQLKKFLGGPDEVAVGEDGFECELYLRKKVDTIVASPEYQQAQEKRREVADKTRETRQRIAKEKEDRRAEKRALFDGKVYLATYTCKKGRLEMGVLAKDKALAKELFERWLISPQGKSFPKDCYSDILDDYKECLKEYREEYRYDMRNYGRSDLIEPLKPLLSDYVMELSQVKEDDTNLDTDMFEIEEITDVSDEIEGYDCDFYGRSDGRELQNVSRKFEN